MTDTANTAETTLGEGRTCPRCGLSETTLRAEGLLGCAACYETFADLVAQAAAALQGVTLAPPRSAAASAPAEPETAPVVMRTTRKPLSWLPHRARPRPKPTRKRSAE